MPGDPSLIKPSCVSPGPGLTRLTQHDILQAPPERASRFRSPSEKSKVWFQSAVHHFKVCFVLSELSENRCRFTKTIGQSVPGLHTCLQKHMHDEEGGQRNVFFFFPPLSLTVNEIVALILLYNVILNFNLFKPTVSGQLYFQQRMSLQSGGCDLEEQSD